MDYEAIRGQLVTLAESELGRPVGAAELGDDVELAAAFDSMQLLSLVVSVEDHFRVIIEDEDEAGIVTVRDLLDVIAARREDPEP